tara:strand:- start:762 stop:1007 length:246 start_codon:yes stop_codon:yes gene_type:complete
MRPQLVEYDKIFKKKLVPEIESIKKPRIQIQQIDNFNFFFNIVGIIVIIVGLCILYYRKVYKEDNKRKNIQRIVQLYHDIN